MCKETFHSVTMDGKLGNDDNKVFITVHDGKMHYDDTAAVALFNMRALILGKKVEVIRTRDPNKFMEVVVDVGEMTYDHHGSRYGLDPDGVPYSGVSRLWEDIGVFVCGSKEVADEFKHKVLDPISKLDNGQQLDPTDKNYLYFVKWLVPGWHSSVSDDEAFEHAVAMTQEMFEIIIGGMQDAADCRKAMQQLLADNAGAEILEIEPGMDNWLTELTDSTVKFCVLGADDGTWYLLTVPADKNNPFISKQLLPEEWAGKRGKDLEAVLPFECHDAVFCHNGRFIAGFQSRESAFKAGEAALR